MRIAGVKKMVERDLKRSFHNKADLPKSFTKKFKVETHIIDHQTIWTISPLKNNTDQTILYVHGGAYIYGVHRQYWSAIEALVLQTNARVIIPDYPLAPENTAIEVNLFMKKIYV